MLPDGLVQPARDGIDRRPLNVDLHVGGAHALVIDGANERLQRSVQRCVLGGHLSNQEHRVVASHAAEG